MSELDRLNTLIGGAVEAVAAARRGYAVRVAAIAEGYRTEDGARRLLADVQRRRSAARRRLRDDFGVLTSTGRAGHMDVLATDPRPWSPGGKLDALDALAAFIVWHGMWLELRAATQREAARGLPRQEREAAAVAAAFAWLRDALGELDVLAYSAGPRFPGSALVDIIRIAGQKLADTRQTPRLRAALDDAGTVLAQELPAAVLLALGAPGHPRLRGVLTKAEDEVKDLGEPGHEVRVENPVTGRQQRVWRRRRKPLPDALPASAADPDAQLLDADAAQRGRAVLAALPPMQREVARLHLNEELTLKQIAARLNKPIGTIKPTWSAVLAKLRAVGQA